MVPGRHLFKHDVFYLEQVKSFGWWQEPKEKGNQVRTKQIEVLGDVLPRLLPFVSSLLPTSGPNHQTSFLDYFTRLHAGCPASTLPWLWSVLHVAAIGNVCHSSMPLLKTLHGFFFVWKPHKVACPLNTSSLPPNMSLVSDRLLAPSFPPTSSCSFRTFQGRIIACCCCNKFPQALWPEITHVDSYSSLGQMYDMALSEVKSGGGTVALFFCWLVFLEALGENLHLCLFRF